MTDQDVLRHITRRLDNQDQLLADIREAQIRHESTYAEIKPSLDEVVAFWKGSRLLAKILSTLAALALGGAGVFAWAKDHFK